MDFSYSSEQSLLGDAVHAYLVRHYPDPVGRPSFEDHSHAHRWLSIAEGLGVTSLALPQASGGMGGDPVDTLVVMQEFGTALVVEPFVETVVIAAQLLANSTRIGATAAVEQIARGKARYALAHDAGDVDWFVSTHVRRSAQGWSLHGRKDMVIAAPWADWLIVSAPDPSSDPSCRTPLLFLVKPSTPGVGMTSYATIDGRCAADVTFDNVLIDDNDRLQFPGPTTEILEAVLDAARAAQGAEALGVMRRMLKDTIEYTKQRQQFGKALAEFQVLRHRITDMAIEIEKATSVVYLGTLKLGAPARERALALSAMKVTVAGALRYVWQNAIQLHGGMGMTDELALGHFAKRAIAIEQTYGNENWHLRRFAALRNKTGEGGWI